MDTDIDKAILLNEMPLNENTNKEQAPLQENVFIKAYLEKNYHTYEDTIPFHLIKIEEYLPALHFGIIEARKNFEKIKLNSELPDFENTILAIERASEFFDHIFSTYQNLLLVQSSPALQLLTKEISPLHAEFSNEILLDEVLFSKVKTVFDRKQELNLNSEQDQLLTKTYRNFVRNGSLLKETDKVILRSLDKELSLLFPLFSENLLKATNDFELLLDDTRDLMGLPLSVIESAQHEANKKSYTGKWLFTLQAPSYIPFMQYSEQRELRKKMWMAYSSRCFKGKYDNSEIIKKIILFRYKRAQLLGYKNHAEYILEERMAKTPEKVFDFLQKLFIPSKKGAERDLADIRVLRRNLEGNEDVQPWDFSFLSEKLKERKFKYKEEDLRPFFKLDNVVGGAFEHARRLFGLVFRKSSEVPKYHEEVEIYEVCEEPSGRYMGLLYLDFFPRESKQGGAWVTNYREQGYWDQQLRRPHVSIVCNFTKPTIAKPSLLSYNEVLTFFHEFGHSLHSLLSQVHYRSLSGTNVLWDFVELPSQLMENWMKEKEGLDIIASHYQTAEPLSAEIIYKLKQAEKFQAGWNSLRQLNFAFLDMQWHTQNPETIKDVAQFEWKATEMFRLLAPIVGTNHSTAFSHIFPSSYSAGYYSYKWAEVLDADAFEYFKEKGIFNRQVADRFKEFILSKGGTEDPMELYKKFRGREPDPMALLRRDGLI